MKEKMISTRQQMINLGFLEGKQVGFKKGQKSGIKIGEQAGFTKGIKQTALCRC